MTDHLSWDALNEVADDLVSASDRPRSDAHLRECAECRETVAMLCATIGDAGSLAREVVPPAPLWTDIERSIEARKVTPIPTAVAARPRGWWITPRRLAVAAVVLVASSSALTALVMRRADSGVVVAGASPALQLLPVQWQAAERGYLNSVSELREQLDAQRDGLNPATVATVERSLAAIDLAIAEARAALIQDPASTALSELLASNYRQKVDLLRRATQLNAST